VTVTGVTVGTAPLVAAGASAPDVLVSADRSCVATAVVGNTAAGIAIRVAGLVEAGGTGSAVVGA